MPNYLNPNHKGEIVYDTSQDLPVIQSGTLTALVEQLTCYDKPDSRFNSTFNAHVSIFTELLSCSPRSAFWFDEYWMETDDDASQQLMQIVHDFAIRAVLLEATCNTESLVRMIEQKMRGLDASGNWLVTTSDRQALSPFVLKNMKKLNFLYIDALELARQLTILDSSLYSNIQPMERLGKTWQKVVMPSDAEMAKIVKALGLHSDRVTNWVSRTILIQSNMKRRTLAIKHFVSIAENCNFFCLTSVISTLGSVPIHRLSKTWSMVDARTMKTFGTMRKLIGSVKDFLEYRESLHKANPPCIPDFRIYLRDLAFIEGDLPAMIANTQRIKFCIAQFISRRCTNGVCRSSL
ncbi:cell division cycle-related protein [Elasticomyces elasticus]|nr:cell division cycle-related protein [Elasticomyces elasticus]